MNKRKLAAITVVAAISYFLYYQYTTPPITFKIDSRLVEINDTLKTLSEKLGLKFFSVYSFSTNPQEISDTIPSEVYKTIRQFDIKVIHFYNGPNSKAAEFVMDRPLSFLRPRWYYLYSESSLIEEEIVPSIEDAVKQHRGAPYYGFCQKAEVPNWFFCTHDSGG
ncbi:arylamine N-acetyltransferase [Litchfieldella anticariensis]|nr:arylamine N-acetyltransferase [Halomonas anticariensis]